MSEVGEWKDHENDDRVIDAAVDPYPPGLELEKPVNKAFQLNWFSEGISLTPKIKLINTDN